ncbi:hypothetical protein ACSW9O_00380 [Clostridium perfringens]|uniref:hypothetical protein n=1 Tax=Clostridium perfringens TaxID=1502 RepID=UPI002910BACE|nr:hypothetical protein [Clostridium perfringens]BDA35679.1 hypothetical protein CPBEC5_26870 [Clostridium perfringens]
MKAKRREETRVSLYKDTIRSSNGYISRSLNVTELELMELIKKAIKDKVFSKEFIERLKEEINNI